MNVSAAVKPRVLTLLALAFTLLAVAGIVLRKNLSKPLVPPVRTKKEQGSIEQITPFHIRDGLPNLARKLAANQDVTIAFLGGSITENPAGFSTSVPAWFRERFPQANIRAVNAGWGGTGSELGAQRIDREVLKHRPAAVFVEFAVNDGKAAQIAPMERIVRKIWTANPETDVVFLYSLDQSNLPMYARGRLPKSNAVHEQVAAHYGVPAIFLGREVARRVLSNEMPWEEFSADVCHPSLAGYERYLEAIVAALPPMLQAGTAGPRKLPVPLTENLVLYPPPVPPAPIDVPAAMETASGERAQRIFPLPSPGVQWTGTPEYRAEGETRWRIIAQPKFSPAALDATAGLNRAKWGGDIEWLDEAGFFLGPSGRWLAGGRGERAGNFGSNRKEQGIITFIAPLPGRYVVEWGADDVAGFSVREKEVGMNVVHFPKGAVEGRSVDFHRSTRAAMKPFTRRAEFTMSAGDELAFVFLQKDLGDCWYRGFRACIGWLGNKEGFASPDVLPSSTVTNDRGPN